MGTSTTAMVTRKGSEPPSVVPEPAPSPETPSAFRLYFNELAETTRMSPSQELRCALELRRLRRALWCVLLSHTSAAPDVLELLGVVLEPRLHPTSVVEAYRKALEGPGTGQPEADRIILGSIESALAEALVDADREHRVASEVVALAWTRARTEPQSRAWARRSQSAFDAVKRARDAFVAANLGLVIAVVRRYDHQRLSFLDLVQEGNTGLLKAVDRFDPRRGVRFSTYAVWWIRHAVGRALSDKAREIRLPCHVVERQQALRRARLRFEQRHGRHPSIQELAQESGIPEKKTSELLSVEMERAVGHDREAGTAGLLEVDELAAESEPIERHLDRDVLELGLRNAMRKLTPQQLDVLTRRFGLDGDEPMTLREVGELHSLSRERIRQVQNRALDTLRREFRRRGMVS